MTGEPGRTGNFGVDLTKRPFRYRRFSFDSLTFPACTECNTGFGVLESAVEPVVRKLLAAEALDPQELILFLDWLDKVRIGLWLGFYYLDKNFAGIDPRFHITQRLGMYDRLVGIVRLEKSSRQRLTFSGTDSRFYQLSPTCLGLGINDLYFISASGVSLCSQRLGFPYLQPVGIREDRQMIVSPQEGSKRIRYPVERINSLPGVVFIYQPVFKWFVEAENGAHHLANDWVERHTADLERGYGKLFLQRNGAISVYGDHPSLDWIPSQTWKLWELASHLPPYIYGRLRRDFESAIGLYSAKGDRRHMRQQANMVRRLDAVFLQRIGEAAALMRARDEHSDVA